MGKAATLDEIRRQFAFEHNGVRVYRCLRHCGVITLSFWYAIDPRGIHEPIDDAVVFDVRQQGGAGVLCGSLLQFSRVAHEHIIRAAIDAGALRMAADVPHVPTTPYVFDADCPDLPF